MIRLAALAAWALCLGPLFVQAQPPVLDKTPAPVLSADEQAIRQVVDQVVKTFNEANAPALAALFTADAEIIDEDNQRTTGRDKIQQVFAGLFAKHPNATMKIDIESIRLLTPTTAVEEGLSTVVRDLDEAEEPGRYVVLYVKQDGQWRMASARDLPVARTGAEELKQLDWLVGSWVDESDAAMVKSSYAWNHSQTYILGEFTVLVNGRPARSGTQRIGWDPLAKKVRSWVFDSTGGYGDGLWTRQGNSWVVKLSGFTADGSVAWSTNTYTQLSKDRFSFESHDRLGGDYASPDGQMIVVVRTPPPPGELNTGK